MSTIPGMDETDEVHRQLRISNLKAKDEMLENERAALFREVISPLTSQDRREEAMRRRAELAAQRDRILDELNHLNSGR
jgi:hypothetical protein